MAGDVVSGRTYVPFLKSKVGERMALRDLDSTTRRAITPGFQLLPGKSAAQLDRDMKQIATGWAGECPVLIDSAWATPVGTDHPLGVASRSAGGFGLQVVPVVSERSDAADVAAARSVVASHGAGVAIRLSPAAWMTSASSVVTSLLSSLGANTRDVDLLLDAGYVGSDALEDLYRSLLETYLPAVPLLDAWRRVVMLAGSMPSELRGIPVGGSGRLPRREWSLYASLPAIPRAIGFGDFGIRHPDATDEMSAPAAIPLWAQLRYTTEASFLVVKDGDVKKEGPRAMYAVSRAVTGAADFDGASYSVGDAWIAARARGTGEVGNYTTWTRVGTGHHISRVVRMLATPSAASARP